MVYLPTISLGPITIYTWGLFVALGMITGVYLAGREVKKRGLDHKTFDRILISLVIAGFIGARLGHVLFYEPAFFLHNPLEILKIWHGGMSSMGGFLGATLTGIYRLRAAKLPILLYADCTALGLTTGWTIGRIGCFLIHDHPGTLSHFILATEFPDGTRRHDLGLYDGLLTLALIGVVLLAHRAKPRTGITILSVALLYAITRFFLDFLRINDTRYFSLTPAQYACILLALLSSVIIHSRFKPSLAS